MSARLALVLCACLDLPFATARRQAQDYEESKFDATVEQLCVPETNAQQRQPPNITQLTATAVTVNVEAVAGVNTVVYLINTYGTVISLVEGVTTILDWSVCWHKDYDPHMTSETINSVRAVAHYNQAGAVCQAAMSAPLETWYGLVNAYENNALDKDYVTSAPWTVTEDEIKSGFTTLKPTTVPTIRIGTRKATVSMARLTGKPVPFLYVKDSVGRVMWWKTFTAGEQPPEDTTLYTSEEFSIPLVSTTIEACAPLSIYKTQCSVIDLTEDIITSVPLPTTTLDASRGAFHLASSGSDKYTVTPQSADYTTCAGTYILYAKRGGGTRSSPTLGLSIGSALTITLDDATMTSGFTVVLACPDDSGTASRLTVTSATLTTDKAAAEANSAVNPPSGAVENIITVQQCEGGKNDQEEWDCDQCDGGKCLCDFPLVICSGAMAAGEHITTEEAVGIAIAVVIIVVVICGVAYFFYKKRMLSGPRLKSAEVEVRETMPMAEAEPSAPKREQV